MDAEALKVINKMHETIKSMGVVLNEVASFRCHGRKEMETRLGELSATMRELNKPAAEITAEAVKRLRVHTGEGLMACKKALVWAKGDFDQAVEHLHRMGCN